MRLATAPGAEVSYGTPGVGTLHQLLVERFMERIDGRAVHVPYSGGTALLSDLLQDRLTFGTTTTPLAQEHVRTGGLRVFDGKRSSNYVFPQSA